MTAVMYSPSLKTACFSSTSRSTGGFTDYLSTGLINAAKAAKCPYERHKSKCKCAEWAALDELIKANHHKMPAGPILSIAYGQRGKSRTAPLTFQPACSCEDGEVTDPNVPGCDEIFTVHGCFSQVTTAPARISNGDKAAAAAAAALAANDAEAAAAPAHRPFRDRKHSHAEFRHRRVQHL
ncbi:hypothetical protein HK405_008301 [Cladochytrium tenue]|nr:hypothetical protein HK405_008301 [Cladochytrium tenue]